MIFRRLVWYQYITIILIVPLSLFAMTIVLYLNLTLNVVEQKNQRSEWDLEEFSIFYNDENSKSENIW